MIKAGSTCDSLVCLSDMRATYAAITGYELTDGMGEDSFNAWPAFLGSDEPIRKSIITGIATHWWLREGGYALQSPRRNRNRS